MEVLKTTTNVFKTNDEAQLNKIHQVEFNLVVLNRGIDILKDEVSSAIKNNIQIQFSGNYKKIIDAIKQCNDLNEFKELQNDIEKSISLFYKISKKENLKLILRTIDNNLCRKFHTDIHDLRMLCTYAGAGTLWLNNDNIDFDALNNCAHNECIVRNPKEIKQANVGDILIFKGALYPDFHSNPLVHKSPELNGNEKRLMLRIDTNEFSNF